MIDQNKKKHFRIWGSEMLDDDSTPHAGMPAGSGNRTCLRLSNSSPNST